jgi:hypothetical protein
MEHSAQIDLIKTKLGGFDSLASEAASALEAARSDMRAIREELGRQPTSARYGEAAMREIGSNIDASFASLLRSATDGVDRELLERENRHIKYIYIGGAMLLCLTFALTLKVYLF